MSIERKSISKKTRFEVFKRDSFTCQYCGAKSPDVNLELDHITPVSKGGDNELLNLVTSCFDCNRGKSNNELSDDSVVVVQREQLSKVQERRNQLELLQMWKEELFELENDTVEFLCDYITEVRPSISVSDVGMSTVRKWISKYDLELITESIDKSFSTYEDSEIAFQKVDSICHLTLNPYPKHMKEIFYIRGILRNRLHYINEKKVLIKLREAYNVGVDLDTLKEEAIITKNYSSYMETVEMFIEREL